MSTPVVRYYGRVYNLSLFEGKGWRGFVVIKLARLVAWLERRIERCVMRLIAKRQGLSPSAVKELESAFSEEDRARTLTKLLGADAMAAAAPRQDRYRTRKFSEEPEQEAAPRTQPPTSTGSSAPLGRLFSIHQAPPRSRKYAPGRDTRVADVNGDATAAWDSDRREWTDDTDYRRSTQATGTADAGQPEDRRRQGAARVP